MQEKKSFTSIVVFQQQGSGAEKIAGIKKFGHDIAIKQVFNIDDALPDLIDEPLDYLPTDFTADVALSFLKHPDLAEGLALICEDKKIPLVASGAKIKNAITPFTCCGLGKTKKLGAYGEQFGFPEFSVSLQNGKINNLEVLRGASCGATWLIATKIIGLDPQEAISSVAREVQYLCKADPSSFDPISGKSPLHYAGDVHCKALIKAIENCLAATEGNKDG